MKKTIVIVILVVYIASIAVVNFFGLKIKEFEGVEYVQEIKCDSITVLSENPKTYGLYNDPAAGDHLEFRFQFIEAPEGEKYTKDPESLAKNPNVVSINYDVLPHLADESKVEFVFEDENYVHFDETTKTFVFLKFNRSVTVTIRATDGSNVSTTIEIKSRRSADPIS